MLFERVCLVNMADIKALEYSTMKVSKQQYYFQLIKEWLCRVSVERHVHVRWQDDAKCRCEDLTSNILRKMLVSFKLKFTFVFSTF